MRYKIRCITTWGGGGRGTLHMDGMLSICHTLLKSEQHTGCKVMSKKHWMDRVTDPEV